MIAYCLENIAPVQNPILVLVIGIASSLLKEVIFITPRSKQKKKKGQSRKWYLTNALASSIHPQHII